VGTVPGTSEPVLFFENQRLPLLAAILIAAAACIPLTMAVMQFWPGEGEIMLRSLLFLAPVLAVLAALCSRIRITTRLYPDRLEIRSYPCAPDSIPLREIARFEIGAFTPVRGRLICESRTYMLGGRQAVEITLASGGSVIVGSRDPERLARELGKAMGA
jgi:hypothetical protein